MNWELVILGLLIFQLVLILAILRVITNLLRDIAEEKCREKAERGSIEGQTYLRLQKPTETEMTAREIRREQALGERDKQKQEHTD